MIWDFCESVPISSSSGSFHSALSRSATALGSVSTNSRVGSVQAADAADHPFPDESAHVWFTDPPYYDSVPYAHLSDFFFVWLKRALTQDLLSSDPAQNAKDGTTPKDPEIVVDRPHRLSTSSKDAASYEQGMANALAEGHRILRRDGIASVVFAHKTTEGWEALLSGMIRGGWTLTGPWPIATEMGARLNARETASLATSVHLICRPRPSDAPIGDWADVLRELPARVQDWMSRLQGEGVRGADLVFACIGPALEIYSRYEAVETAEGHAVELPEYLEKVWDVVGRAALQQILGSSAGQIHDGNDGLTGALEEDARLTALFLWTLQSTEVDADESADGANEDTKRTSNFSLPFDIVRRFAQPMGIDLDSWSNRVITQTKGIVRLMPVPQRSKIVFGDDAPSHIDDWSAGIEKDDQPTLFDDIEPATPSKTTRHRGATSDRRDLGYDHATTLDRVHAAMLLQGGGNANALRILIDAEINRGPDFLRLANALSALYPRSSDEKRLLDAMLLAVPR